MAVNETQRKVLSFAEAEGQLPNLFRWGEMSERLRAQLYAAFWDAFNADLSETYFAGHFALADDFRDLLYDEWVDRQYLAADEFKDRGKPRDLAAPWKDIFFHGEYVTVLDLVTFLARHPNCPPSLVDGFVAAFENGGPHMTLADPFTLVPAATDEERELLASAHAEIGRSPYAGARQHLGKAAECLNTNDTAGAIRESIHAVESAAKTIASKPKASLPEALNALRTSGIAVHPQFEQAIKNLYNYTSDEKGVRHALLNAPANVDLNEAIFMYQACVALVSYFSRIMRTGLAKIE